MQTLDDITLYTGKAKKLTAIISRDKQLLQLPLTLPPPSQAVRLSVRDAAQAARWLDKP